MRAGYRFHFVRIHVGGGAKYCDERSVCLFVCLSVCLSVRWRISKTTHPIFTKFPLSVTRGPSLDPPRATRYVLPV